MIKKRDNNTPALDMMFMVALSFLLLIFMMVPFLNPITKDGTIEPRDLLWVEAEWPVEDDVDVDLYVKGPDGVIVYYNNKTNGYITLKKDDLGRATEKTFIDGQWVEMPRNYEVISLSDLPDGWYVVNIHIFSSQQGLIQEVSVKVTDTKDASTVYIGTEHIASRNELTFISFRVEDGEIVELDQEVQHKLRRFPSP
jgi:hypothetical protein